MAAYLLFAFGLTLSYRSGRPDALNMLLCVCLLWALEFQSRVVRWATLLFLSALLAWAGFQSLVYVALLSGLAFLFFRRPRITDGVAVGFGFALGLATLCWLYHAHGVWEGFRQSISYHSHNSFLAHLRRGEMTFRGFVPGDPSLYLLLAGSVAVLWLEWRRGIEWRQSWLVFAVSLAIALQVAMPILGRYPTYYGYMAHIPLALALAQRGVAPQRERWLAGTILVCGCLVGAPLQLGTMLADLPGRDYRLVETFVDENVPADTFVFMEPAAYYAVRARTPHYFTPLALSSMRPAERENITLALLNPSTATGLLESLGGAWVKTENRLAARPATFFGKPWNVGFLTLPKYSLEIWQRQPSSSVSHPSP